MKKVFPDGSKPRQQVLDLIVSYMQRINHPLYLGYISLEIGYSLAQTQAMIDMLVKQEIIRHLSEKELKEKNAHPDASIYTLVELPSKVDLV